MKTTTTVYACDYCGAVLSDGADSKTGKSKEHLSIRFGRPVGWAVFDGIAWDMVNTEASSTIKQFCDVLCLGSYFDQIRPESATDRE